MNEWMNEIRKKGEKKEIPNKINKKEKCKRGM